MKTFLLTATMLAAFATNVFADETVIRDREGPHGDNVRIGVPGPDVDVRARGGCDTKTVTKEDGAGDSKTVKKTDC
jgi:hypothetical protein